MTTPNSITLATNQRHNGELATAAEFRDFLLVAAVQGARIGYDASGDMWAVVDEGDATLPQIIYCDSDSSIWAQGGAAMPDGNFLEWKPCPEFDGDEGRMYFYLTLTAPTLIYDPAHGWAVDAEGDTSEFVWYPAPTVPADRIEEMARELALAAA